MRLEDDAAVKEIVTRLRRVRGQVDGVIAMIEDGRSCRDVVMQVSAASRALDRAGYKIIATGLLQCLADEGPDGEDRMSPEDLEKLFLSLA